MKRKNILYLITMGFCALLVFLNHSNVPKWWFNLIVVCFAGTATMFREMIKEEER